MSINFTICSISAAVPPKLIVKLIFNFTIYSISAALCPKSIVKLIFPTKITWFQLFFFRPYFLNVNGPVALRVAGIRVGAKSFPPTITIWFQLFFFRPHFLNLHFVVALCAVLGGTENSCKDSSSSSVLRQATVLVA